MYNVLINGLNGDEIFNITFQDIQSFTELIKSVIEYIKENNDEGYSDYTLIYNYQTVYKLGKIEELANDIKLENNIIFYLIKTNNNINDLIEKLINIIKDKLNIIKDDLKYFYEYIGQFDKYRGENYTFSYLLNHHHGLLSFKDIIFSNKLVIYNKIKPQENIILLNINESSIIEISENIDKNYKIIFTSIENPDYSQYLILDIDSLYFDDFYNFLYQNIDNDDKLINKFKKMFEDIFETFYLIYI